MIPSDFDPQKPYTYVRYGRMSDPGQNPRSPDQQFTTVEETRKRCGFPWVQLEDYRDDGISGRYLRKRTGFQRMLTDIRTGKHKPDLVLVDTVMRFGRCEELESIQRELRNKFGILLLSADTNFADPSSEAGRAMRFANNFQATAEGRTKAHNVLRGKRDAVRLGHWPGGPAPLGKRLKSVMKVGVVPVEVDYRVLEHDPETADYIKEMYRHKHELDWGTTRSAKHFNSDPEFVRKVGHIDASTIGRILDNPIYRGELVWGVNCTDVVDDRRIIRRNPDDQVIRNKDFCEPLVEPAVWYEVERKRRKDGQKISESRRRAKANNGKLLQPRAPGFVLTYPLTGLVRCAVCGASMTPASSGTKSKAGKRYTRYRCPTRQSGACNNEVTVPEDWLRDTVIDALRRRLFPAPSSEVDGALVPEWFGELYDQVQDALRMRCKAEANQSTLLQREREEIWGQINGWMQSLSKTDIPESVRRLVEEQVGEATARIDQIDREVAQVETRDAQFARALDPTVLLEALHRLDDVLAGASASRMNAELSMHIDRIAVHPDRRVILHSCKLGAFEGLDGLLLSEKGSQNDAVTVTCGAGASSVHCVRPRRRAKLQLNDEFDTGQVVTRPARDISDPHRFAGLPANWFWEDTFELPTSFCWSKRHADEVARIRREESLSLAKLAKRFGKSIPTIRRALRAAAERPGD